MAQQITPSAPRRLLWRVPGARRLRFAWERVRPFPLPRYLPNTPKLGGSGPLDPFIPPTAATVGAAAMSQEALEFLLAVCDRLAPNEPLAMQQFRLRWSQAKFGRHWRFANLLTALWASATLIRPSSYLEIGVWRGRSAAVVGSVCPRCDIYGFDLWIPDFGGAPNPGPDFVRDELRAVGHAGNVTLISGDSHRTLPNFLRQHPDLYFDLITIDGDKSIRVAASDFAHALPRLKVGGIVLSDDLPVAPMLRRIWRKVIERDRRYATWEFADARFGVAVAVRVAD